MHSWCWITGERWTAFGGIPFALQQVHFARWWQTVSRSRCSRFVNVVALHVSGVFQMCFRCFSKVFLVCFRWAVSTVMTRQNQIPSAESEDDVDTALIPLWDMCNHTNGWVSSAVDAFVHSSWVQLSTDLVGMFSLNFSSQLSPPYSPDCECTKHIWKIKFYTFLQIASR